MYPSRSVRTRLDYYIKKLNCSGGFEWKGRTVVWPYHYVCLTLFGLVLGLSARKKTHITHEGLFVRK
jgi:hypothetical protein